MMRVLLGHPAYVRAELFAFEEFLKISEELLPTAKLLRFQRDEQEAAGPNAEEDGGDIYIAREEAIEAAERVYPRYLRGANVIALYALLESSIDRMAEAFAGKTLGASPLNRLRGSLEQRKAYFEEELDQPIYEGSDRGLWGRLKMLMTLRHVLAHDSGRYEYSVHLSGGWPVAS
jgi:hypothetical protein